MTAPITVRPVEPADLGALGELFDSARTTRHCWCMSFCSGRAAFAAGWLGGGNRRRFEAMVSEGAAMGLLASVGASPVGWAACGPRARYRDADPSRHPLLGERLRSEDATVWLLPCLFVRPGHRGQGVSHALVGAAVGWVQSQGATALEAWPSSGETGGPEAFTGPESLFAELGFRCVDRPTPDRALMRIDLDPPPVD